MQTVFSQQAPYNFQIRLTLRMKTVTRTLHRLSRRLLNLADTPLISTLPESTVELPLTLLHLGIKNIKLGPTLPAFLSKNVLNYLIEHFAIAPTTTPEADLAELLNK